MDLYLKGRQNTFELLKEEGKVKINSLTVDEKMFVKVSDLEELKLLVHEQLSTKSYEEFPIELKGIDRIYPISSYDNLKIFRDDLMEFNQLLNTYNKRETTDYLWGTPYVEKRFLKITDVIRSKDNCVIIISDGDEHGLYYEKVLIKKDIAENLLSKPVFQYANERKMDDYYVFDIAYNDFILVLFADLPAYWDTLNQTSQTGGNTDQIKEWIVQRLEKKYEFYVKTVGWEKISDNLSKIPQYPIIKKEKNRNSSYEDFDFFLDINQ